MRKLPEGSIDLVVTSSPYWGLRDYGPEAVRVWGGDQGCEHEWTEFEVGLAHENRQWKSSTDRSPSGKETELHGRKRQLTGFCIHCGAWWGQLGLEPHPQMFIDHMVGICREIGRVLKPTGSLWLNLGDTYCAPRKYGGGPQSFSKGKTRDFPASPPQQTIKSDEGWLQPKQLLGIPERVMIGLQDDGWILRNKVVWYKPNHMPDPAKDRLTRAHEAVLFLVKGRKYHFDLDAIRVPHQTKATTKFRDKSTEGYNLSYSGGRFSPGLRAEGHPKGKNPGDVWNIPTKPFPGAHFAVFPEALVEPIIKAGCPRDGIVLDPFVGSGTTCAVAKRLGRRWLGIDIVPEYVEMARKRVGGTPKSLRRVFK